MIITRYLTTECCKNAGIICVILTLLVFCNRIVWFLTRMAGGTEKWQGIILQASILWIPQFLVLLLPLSMVFGILLTLQRLGANHEIEAIYASGFQEITWIKQLGLIGVGTALLTGFFSLVLSPVSLRLQNEMATENNAFLTQLLFTPGQFQDLPGSQGILYVSRPAESGALSKDVFVFNPTKQPPGELDIVLARSAGQAISPFKDRLLTLTLQNGMRIMGNTGASSFSTTTFKKFVLNPEQVAPEITSDPENTLSTLSLIKSPNPEHTLELIWRFSIPLMSCILVFLTLPLYRPRPKQERLGMLFLCITLILLYPNALLIARSQNSQMLSPLFYQILIHLFFGGMGIILIKTPRLKQLFFKRGS